jgi:hypothetical protein
MHYVTGVEYDTAYRLLVTFDDGATRLVDLASHLEGEVFEPLKDLRMFRTAHLNRDIDTVVWANGADMSPDFLYEIGTPAESARCAKAVAEGRTEYGKR